MNPNDEGYILTCRLGADVLRGLEESLTEAGYSVRSLEDGAEIVTQVSSAEPDLVLIDESIDEVRRSLGADGDPVQSEKALTALYQQKMQLLWKVSRLSS